MFVRTIEPFIDHHAATTMTLHSTLLKLIFHSGKIRCIKFRNFFVKFILILVDEKDGRMTNLTHYRIGEGEEGGFG
jgi:hypothetical protein